MATQHTQYTPCAVHGGVLSTSLFSRLTWSKRSDVSGPINFPRFFFTGKVSINVVEMLQVFAVVLFRL